MLLFPRLPFVVVAGRLLLKSSFMFCWAMRKEPVICDGAQPPKERNIIGPIHFILSSRTDESLQSPSRLARIASASPHHDIFTSVVAVRPSVRLCADVYQVSL